MDVLVVVVWLLSPVAGFIIGAHKRCSTIGVVLGLILGPIGAILTGFCDERTCCSRCGTRWNNYPTHCPGCHSTIEWNAKKTQFRLTPPGR